MKRTSPIKYRDVIGYEKYYRIYDNGDIFSYRKGFLEPQLNNDGYYSITLCVDYKIKRFLVHRLLFLNFVGDIPDGLQINHIDGVKTNNNLSNLELCTPLENTRHAWSLGLVKKKLGEQTSLAKITETKVREIRKLFKLGLTQVEIAKKFNIHQTNVHYIISNKTWSHVT